MVEDSPHDAALVRSVLGSQTGLTTDLVHRNRLQAGIDYLEHGTADIVLLDFSLPDSKGLDTFRRVNSEHPEVPVIVLTSLEETPWPSRQWLRARRITWPSGIWTVDF